jgi:hypothetical protein
MRVALHTRVRRDRIDDDYSPGGGSAVLPAVWQL